MTNRDKYFTKKNPYDLLIAIHKNTTKCAIKVITGCRDKDLPCSNWGWIFEDKTCEQCLQKWLNASNEKGLDSIQ